MKVQQEIITTHGDLDPLTYGGGVVRRDEKEYLWWEYCHGVDRGDIYSDEIPVYRVHIDCSSAPSNDFDWINREAVESFIGSPLPDDTDVDAWCVWLDAIEGYYGADELDCYPETFNAEELRQRWEL